MLGESHQCFAVSRIAEMQIETLKDHIEKLEDRVDDLEARTK
jgi:hypothetical protein